MLAIADETALYLLEFVDRRGLEREIELLRKKTKSAIIPGSSDPILSIQQELHRYFEGKLSVFKTQICTLGTPFQKLVWEELKKIPFGETRSYAEIACSMGNPVAYRAVARANGANCLALIIPCHRVVNSSGELGGYGGGIVRKKWLICHEEKAK
jgi:AraC family transcriptional regulator of adaptative response/methylated-DNA-[protein]-cysteine methyltransferase